jgi:hypothetical protein
MSTGSRQVVETAARIIAQPAIRDQQEPTVHDLADGRRRPCGTG